MKLVFSFLYEILFAIKSDSIWLSFANSAYDVLKFRQLIGGNSNLISKIETSEAVKNLDKIIRASDKILIDRGDLSRYVPIENIPIVQMQILKKASLKIYSIILQH